MKKIDFSYEGGYPLSQDTLDFLQQSYRESIKAIVEMGGTGPIALSGCAVTHSGGNVTVTNGWIYYQGEIIQVTGGTTTEVLYGHYPAIGLHPVDSPVTYNNGSVNYAIHYNSGIVFSSTSNVDNSTQFRIAGIVPFQLAFGAMARPAGGGLSVNTTNSHGNIAGTLNYRKDVMANTLRIWGAFATNHAENFSTIGDDDDSIPITLQTLPTNLRPLTQSCFQAGIGLKPVSFTDTYGHVMYLGQLNGFINIDGTVVINCYKPTTGQYTLQFHITISLD